MSTCAGTACSECVSKADSSQKAAMPRTMDSTMGLCSCCRRDSTKVPYLHAQLGIRSLIAQASAAHSCQQRQKSGRVQAV